MFYLVLGLSFFLIASLVRLKKSFFFELAKRSLSLVNELISDEDEDTKIEEIQKSTNKLLISLLKVFSLIIVSFIIGSIPLVIYCFGLDVSFTSLDFSSFYSILSISIGATIPFIIPAKKTSDYSDLSQLLHHMILDNYHIAEKLFRIEKKQVKKKSLKRNDEFIIITGLARAGTTSLMMNLSKIPAFTSLSYANMPFLTSPNLWAKVYKPKKEELKERSHKDGIMIGLDSNEALEEYFFKMKAKDSFIKDDSLSKYHVPEKDYHDYLDYQSIIKNDNHKIYLAKNNNFILRYKSIRDYNETFIMVVLFRDPLAHANSLLEKHIYYSQSQQEDPFILTYMNWLGHHEFGLNQKPFVFEDSENLKSDNKHAMEFWIKSWVNYYTYALEMQHTNTLFINYSTYCNQPNNVIETILNKTKIDNTLHKLDGFQNNRKITTEVDSGLLDKAMQIYDKLCKLESST